MAPQEPPPTTPTHAMARSSDQAYMVENTLCCAVAFPRCRGIPPNVKGGQRPSEFPRQLRPQQAPLIMTACVCRAITRMQRVPTRIPDCANRMQRVPTRIPDCVNDLPFVGGVPLHSRLGAGRFFAYVRVRTQNYTIYHGGGPTRVHVLSRLHYWRYLSFP